ncbi:hypothetical protein GCM10010425_06860 [Streptomyces spororaveus]|uniref:Uncharacterized protein n=1 Tax=Streptomyces spororaveus TaxID=284039 RepID=A0ABQ3TEY1_9ACTN|nr:hypothetical protein Sspor_45450 [Streptomyces spororaveus]
MAPATRTAQRSGPPPGNGEGGRTFVRTAADGPLAAFRGRMRDVWGSRGPERPGRCQRRPQGPSGALVTPARTQRSSAGGVRSASTFSVRTSSPQTMYRYFEV